jgi:hypothetical protein
MRFAVIFFLQSNLILFREMVLHPQHAKASFREKKFPFQEKAVAGRISVGVIPAA